MPTNRRAALVERTPGNIEYPESDGRPMGETELHIREIMRLMQTLDAAFAERADVYVGADLLVYYEEGNPGAVVVLDVMVVVGAPKLPLRRTYKIWEETNPPTFVIEVTSRSSRDVDRSLKPTLYAQLGVQEYVLYDPDGEYLTPALQGYQLVSGAYQLMAAVDDGTLVSDALNLRLSLLGGRLRVTDRATEAALLSPVERVAELEELLRQLREPGR